MTEETAGRGTLRRIMEQMRADPDVLDGVVTEVRAQSPQVAALPVAEVRRHIAALLGVASAAFIDSTGLGVEAADRLATDRALQGVPLSALLAGFQTGRAHVLRELGGRLRQHEMLADDFVAALLELDGYANKLQNRLVEAYRETELRLARTAQAARVQALRELLKGGPATGVVNTGLAEDRHYHVALADVSDPRQARRAEAALAETFCVTVDGLVCGVAVQLPDLSPVADILTVVTPAVLPKDFGAAYQACRAALQTGRCRGLSGAVRLTELVVDLVTDGFPALGRMLADDLLAGLAATDDFHRLLASTALTYLDHGGRVDATALALHVHPNTVKHRLRRLAELTGFSPPEGSLAEALRWRWAVDTWLRSTGAWLAAEAASPPQSSRRNGHQVSGHLGTTSSHSPT
jgi:PucR C-terminal helix-turn-helix domain